MLRSVIADRLDEIRILHVDDDENQSEFLKYFLPANDDSFHIDSVTDPNKVFECLKGGNYDCVVTDFQMPKINGIELADMIRTQFDIPIIIYTGQGSEEVAEKAFSVGIDDYMRKEMDPSHYKVLAKRVRHVVDKKRMEKLYRNVIEQTRDALSIFVDGILVFANQSTLNLLGVKDLSDIVGRNPFDVGQDDNVNQKFLETGFHEFKLKGKNGDFIYIEVSTSPITYNGREAILCFARDVTERKLLEAEKKVSQERFKTLVDISPDGITSINPLGYVTFANEAFLKVTRFSQEEIVGKHLTSVGTIRKKDILKHLNTFASILKGEDLQPIEFTWQTKEGAPGVGEAHISLIEIDGRKEILLIVKDITNWKKKEKEFSNIFNQTQFGILQLDPQGAVTSLNDAALKLTELRRSQAIGKNINTIFNIEEGDITRLHSLLNGPATRQKKLKPCELKIRNSNSSLWVEAYPSLTEVDNENYGLQLIFRDITSKKLLEDERRRYSQRLEAFMHEIGNRFDSIVVSQLDKEIKVNLEQIEELLTRLRLTNKVDSFEIMEIEKAISNIGRAIDTTAKRHLVDTPEIVDQVLNVENEEI